MICTNVHPGKFSFPASGKLLISLLATAIFSASAQQAATTAPAAVQTTGNEILAHEPNGSSVGAADVLSELRRAPEKDRKTILSRPEMAQQIANNLLVRRVLAAEAQRDGLGVDPVLQASLAIARDRILSDALLAKMDTKNNPSESVTEAYARNIYQSNTARFEKPAETRAHHILLENKGPESLQKAKNLLAQLRSGASFEDLAKANSTDLASAARGGDLGFVKAGMMVDSFEAALNKLSKPGELSEPVETTFGYHIIRFDERKEKVAQPFSAVREKLLEEAKVAILSEYRAQKVKAISADFVFEPAAFDALARAASQ